MIYIINTTKAYEILKEYFPPSKIIYFMELMYSSSEPQIMLDCSSLAHTAYTQYGETWDRVAGQRN